VKSAFPVCIVIFLVAVGVRFLTWQDNRYEIWRVQTSVVEGYRDSARQLLAGDFKTFVSDINHMGHPPGYPILLAGVFKVAGESKTAIHAVQILCDAAAVVVLFLIALKLVTPAAAIIAAVFAAISPQFAYFSVLLLPDSLGVLPILLAVYFMIRAREQKKFIHFVIAGALIGVSCWLRANALLLAPFLAALSFLFVERGKRLRASAAILAGAIVVIAPITIKNAIVFHRFIPISLGAGQTLLEGIADYDNEERFNIPRTDLGIMRQEAEWYGKPEYGHLLFGPEGVERERMRIRRGLGVIASHPFWFASVVARRAVASTRLEPVPVLERESPVSHDYVHTYPAPVWFSDEWAHIRGDETKYGNQKAWEPIDVRPNTDYVLHVAVKLEEGRVLLKIMDASESNVLASRVVDPMEGVPGNQGPIRSFAIPFVSAGDSQVRLVIANHAAPHSVIYVGPGTWVELGPSSHQWLRYVRIPIGFVQRIFKTAWMLPLVVIGLVFLLWEREWTKLAMILMVPGYYLIVQSALHTERRYVYVLHFFFLILAAHGVTRIILLLAQRTGLKRRMAG
jgi:Dolichyl-phosphate-mannose-protein mannosyltransferase